MASLESLQREKGELVMTIEREVCGLKNSLESLVDEKIDLIKKLFAADNYIKELRITSEHQITDLTNALERERRVSAKLTLSRERWSPRYSSPSSCNSDELPFEVNHKLDNPLSNETKEHYQTVRRLAEANTLIQ
jgi:hypothetical protein